LTKTNQNMGMIIIQKMTVFFVTATVILSLTACEKSQAGVNGSDIETTLDMEKAINDLDDYCAGHPVCIRLDSDEYPDHNIIYDFTGDGFDDIITCFTYGSGLVRDVIVVYDVAGQVFYTLGDEKASYRIKAFDDGLLTAEEYIYPDKYSVGKVYFSGNELSFGMDRTREYFENLDKESSLEKKIVADIGTYGIQGSGIIYHVWKLNDGTEARVVFDSKRKITMIYFVSADNSERIYRREY